MALETRGGAQCFDFSCQLCPTTYDVPGPYACMLRAESSPLISRRTSAGQMRRGAHGRIGVEPPRLESGSFPRPRPAGGLAPAGAVAATAASILAATATATAASHQSAAATTTAAAASYAAVVASTTTATATAAAPPRAAHLTCAASKKKAAGAAGVAQACFQARPSLLRPLYARDSSCYLKTH